MTSTTIILIHTLVFIVECFIAFCFTLKYVALIAWFFLKLRVFDCLNFIPFLCACSRMVRNIIEIRKVVVDGLDFFFFVATHKNFFMHIHMNLNFTWHMHMHIIGIILARV